MKKNRLVTACLVSLFASAPFASARAAGTPAETAPLTTSTAAKLYDRYLAGWNAASETERRALLSEVVSPSIRYTTPRHPTGTRDTVIEDAATFHTKYPGAHFEQGDVSAHHNHALVTWIIVLADGKELARGHDILEVSADGKLAGITTFAPEAPKP